MKRENNKPFARYGHNCTLENLPDQYEYGKKQNYFSRWLTRMTVVSESSKRYTHHLRSYGSIVQERHRQITNYPYTIHPFSRACICWNVLLNIANLMLLVLEPLSFLYYSMENSFVYTSAFVSVKLGLRMVFLFNFIINFFIGYYDEPMQDVVLGHKKIAIHYLKTYFIIDFFCIVPLHWEYFSTISDDVKFILQFCSITNFLTIIRFYKYCSALTEAFDIDYYTVMKMLIGLFTLLFWHVMCSVMTFARLCLGDSLNDTESPVFSPRFLFEKNKLELMNTTGNIELAQFANAFYRGSHIIYNSNYGKSLPSNIYELGTICFGWYASNIFFIYILALFIELMKGKGSSGHKYVEMERQLKDYMRHKQLPVSMRNRILLYYEFRFQRSYFQENEILSTISEQLRQEINMHACRKLVENVVFFRNLPLNLLVRIISCLRIEVYLVNDVIIKANTPGNSMYFISTGIVAIYTKSGKEICHLEDGAHFGEVALIIKGTLRTASVVAVEVSEIYRLDQKDFVKAINPYPDLLANIQRIAAERLEMSSMT